MNAMKCSSLQLRSGVRETAVLRTSPTVPRAALHQRSISRAGARVVCSAEPNSPLPEDSTSLTTTTRLASPPGLLARSMPMLSLAAVTGGGLLGSGFDPSGPGSVLGAVSVLAAVVGVHEAGHFLAARLQNIHVTKFAIGFGPVLFKYDDKDVEYSLRAFPLGGFVAFPDDDPDSPYPIDDPDLLRNRPVLDRMIVTVAGVIANVIFGFALCLVQASTIGISIPTYFPGVKLGNINPDTVAERAGLQRGDLVLQLGDMKIAPTPSAVDSVVTKIQNSPGQTIRVVLQREGKLVELDLTPATMPDGTGRIGVSLGANAKVEKRKASNPGEALTLAADDFKALFGTVVKGLSQFVSNFSETAKNVSGPVAILAVGSEVARTDVTGLYQFAALLNINLAVVNILPLPALDGGSMALLFLEAGRGKPIDKNSEAIINNAGVALLLLSAVYFLTKDLSGYLVFQLLEAIRGGKKLDANLEKGVMASGFLLLTSMGLFLIVRDAITLGSKL